MSKEILEAISQMATKSEVAANASAVSELKTILNTVSEEVKAENAEVVSELKERLKDLEAKAGTVNAAPAEAKSIGEMFVEGDAFGLMVKGQSKTALMEVKATTNAEAETYSQRLAGVVAKPQEQLTVFGAIQKGTATSNAIDYVREASWSNNAAERPDEVTAYGESAFTFDSLQMPIADVGHFTKMSKNMMADTTAVASFITGRMPHGVEKRINAQIVNGTGLTGQIKGLTHTDNHVVYTAAANTDAYTNIRKAIAQIEADEHSASFILMNPVDVANLDLAEGSDGHFKAANARTANAPVVWGVPVIKSKAVAAGKFVLVDSSQVCLWLRDSLAVETSDSDADDFQKGLVTVRAIQRAALTVFNKEGVIYGDLVGATV